MKKLPLLAALTSVGLLVSCNTALDQASDVAAINTPSISTPDVSNLASGVSNVAGLASGVNSVRNLVDDDDGDNDSDKITGYLGAAQLGSGLFSGLKKPKAPGVPAVPGVDGAIPKAPGIPGLPSLSAVSDILPFGNKAPTPIAVEAGMSQAELIDAAGRPSYKYTLNNQETWVYENTSFVSKQIKQTVVNMVPGVGPAASLMTNFRSKPEVARAAVSFDQEGTVKHFTQCVPETAATATKK